MSSTDLKIIQIKGIFLHLQCLVFFKDLKQLIFTLTVMLMEIHVGLAVFNIPSSGARFSERGVNISQIPQHTSALWTSTLNSNDNYWRSWTRSTFLPTYLGGKVPTYLPTSHLPTYLSTLTKVSFFFSNPIFKGIVHQFFSFVQISYFG